MSRSVEVNPVRLNPLVKVAACLLTTAFTGSADSVRTYIRPADRVCALVQEARIISG